MADLAEAKDSKTTLNNSTGFREFHSEIVGGDISGGRRSMKKRLANR